MQDDILKDFIGLVVDLRSKSKRDSLEARLFGARPNEIDGLPPEIYGRVIRGAIETFSFAPKIFAGLGERALEQTQGLLMPDTILEVKALAEPLLPFIREATGILEGITDEDFDRSKDDLPGSRNDHLRALREIVEDVEKLLNFDEAKAATVEVERSLTVTLKGTEADVADLFAKITNLVREQEATSLGLFADRTGVKVSQCSEGHIVVLTEDGDWRTDTEITPQIRDTLGERLLSTEEGAEYIAALEDLPT